ncbi:2-dehydropantoate 2-reductase N-terminal domain-containing protein [Actinomycetospora corticicola]|uniref:2-dehydropantoate 2-reductase n=1 Tax=Actinomycetospora corticicola TaxID=663602 RepID=A0A7Y9J3W1_9PSEU|nr:2-dehydropantoate 2-reductase [Actinomycetospora corticicola]
MDHPSRYVFLGAGAIGSALGGLLARQGREVLLVARGEHARVMADRGVTLRCPDLTETVAVPVATAPDEAHLTVDDVLVLTAKTPQAADVLDTWGDAPVHDRDGIEVGRAADVLPVLVALNGVAGEEIALRRAERVFAVCVWCPTVLLEPGEVIVRGAPLRGVFHLGRYGHSPDPAADSSLLASIATDWEPAGCLVRPTDAVMGWKYRKLIANTGNALEALLGDTTGAEDITTAARAEAEEVLGAADLPVVGKEEARAGWEPEGLEFLPVPGEPAQLGGSSWQSLMRGTGSIESDYLNGEIALTARRIGRPAPVNAGLTALARRAAREGLRPGSITADELRRALGLE